jgi:hypothetical protein
MATDSTRELLAKLLKRREELRIESEALENLINAYTSLSRLQGADVEAPQLDLWKIRNSRKAKSTYVGELLAEVRRLIISEGRPLNRGDLVRRLEAAGYLIDGSDKAKVLGTNIWRSDKFDHIEGEGYWPRDIERSAS